MVMSPTADAAVLQLAKALLEEVLEGVEQKKEVLPHLNPRMGPPSSLDLLCALQRHERALWLAKNDDLIRREALRQQIADDKAARAEAQVRQAEVRRSRAEAAAAAEPAAPRPQRGLRGQQPAPQSPQDEDAAGRDPAQLQLPPPSALEPS